MNYQEAGAKLQGRCYERRKLENNTYLERHYGYIAVKLHATHVLKFAQDGRIEVNTGGWNTMTTRDRINRYLPKPWSVGSERGTTILYKASASYNWNPVATIENSLVIMADGSLDGGGDYAVFVEGVRKADNERSRVRSRARYWLRKARGIYVDRSKCQAYPKWNCETRSRWAHRRGFSEGVYKCRCRVYRKPATAEGLTVQGILAEENVTVRLAKMNIYGIDRFMLDAGANTVNAEAGYDLIELHPRGNSWQRITALKMRCPSTSAVYVQAVPPFVHTVREALDWIFQCEGYLEQVGQQAYSKTRRSHMEKKLIRQGDLAFIATTGIPAYCTAKQVTHGTLGEGEASGHKHRLANLEDAAIFEVSGTLDLYVKVGPNGASIVHEEHKAVTLEPNTVYEVHRAREYDYLQEVSRTVRD